MVAKQLNPNTGWQTVFNIHLEDCIAFCFPEIHKNIDWSQGYEIFEREWQLVGCKDKANQRFIGRPIRLTSIDGKKKTILPLVASEKEDRLSFHLFTCHYRINDLYHQSAISPGRLADDDLDWSLKHDQPMAWGHSAVTFHLQTCKWPDYQKSTSMADKKFGIQVRR